MQVNWILFTLSRQLYTYVEIIPTTQTSESFSLNLIRFSCNLSFFNRMNDER